MTVWSPFQKYHPKTHFTKRHKVKHASSNTIARSLKTHIYHFLLNAPLIYLLQETRNLINYLLRTVLAQIKLIMTPKRFSSINKLLPTEQKCFIYSSPFFFNHFAVNLIVTGQNLIVFCQLSVALQLCCFYYVNAASR